MTQEELEQYVRKRGEEMGFDPDDHVQRWRARRAGEEKGRGPTTGALIHLVTKEMERRGWDKEARLDYAFTGATLTDVELQNYYDWDCQFTPVYGSNEGIYIDACVCYYKRVKDGRGEWAKVGVGCCKTLDESQESMERMGLLAGRLTWLSRHIYP